jgi:hypothetical protein
MILGMSTAHFTTLHVIISLIGIFAGLVVLAGMLNSRPMPAWTAILLATSVLTSATGFLFHSVSICPPHIVGVISLVLLAVSLFALYVNELARSWRWIYVATAVACLYLNVFVGVVQSFQKLSFLQRLAPTQSEPPFVATQIVVLAIFVVLGIRAARRFHPEGNIRMASKFSR